MTFSFFYFSVASFDCGNTKSDIAIVIPSVGSVGDNDDFDIMVASIENLVDMFSEISGRAHFAIVQYAEGTRLRFPLQNISVGNNRRQLSRKLRVKGSNLGSSNFIYSALTQVSEDVFTEGKNRADSLDVAIIVMNKPTSKGDPNTDTVLEDLKVCIVQLEKSIIQKGHKIVPLNGTMVQS